MMCVRVRPFAQRRNSNLVYPSALFEQTRHRMKSLHPSWPLVCLLAGSLWMSLLPLEQAHAGQCVPTSTGDRPRIGLVLGGGGARGGAHVGVLKYLEENRIPVDLVTGTSMGALVGGLYATGMSAAEIEQVLVEADWTDLFNDATDRSDWPLRRKSDDDVGLYGPKFGLGKDSALLPGGAFAGQKVSLLLENLVSKNSQATDFDELPIPFRAIAADLVSGDKVVLGEGQLSQAMRASMSVPGAFDPVERGDALLVDGGIVDNVPVDVARDMGADIIIAVSVGFPKVGADELKDLVSVVNQLSTLMVAGNTEEQLATLGQNDILIEPGLGTDFGSADFARVNETIPVGYEASLRWQHNLKELSLDEHSYDAWRQSVRDCQHDWPMVNFVRLDNRSRFSNEVLEQMITIRPGTPLDHAQLEKDLGHIYALGFIRLARYSIIEEDGQQGVLIEVERDTRGTDFIETGLGISGDGRGTTLDLNLAYLKTDLNDHGAEFRGALQFGKEFGISSELYMPLDSHLRWIFKPDVRISRRDLLVFDNNGDALAELELEEIGGTIAFGREIGRHAGLFLEVSRYGGDIKINVGDPGLDNDRFNGGDWSLNAVYDRLDNRYLPSTGDYIKLQYIDSTEALGADDEFKQVRFSLFSARTWGAHTAWFGTTYDTTLNDDAPVYGLFTGGGFLNMSGFERDQLVNQHFGFTLLGYRYRLGESGLMPAYVGTTVEYGNAASSASEIYSEGILNGSFYLAYDSPLGPLYLGYGWNENQAGLIFIRLGTLFGNQAIGRR